MFNYNVEYVEFQNQAILITGSTGFIGAHLVMELLKTQFPLNIIGIDNMNDYYDVSIKVVLCQEFVQIKSDQISRCYI